jgi:hypothetical protein
MVVPNMTRRRRTPVENDPKNNNPIDGLIESNPPHPSSFPGNTNTNNFSEAQRIGPLARQLLDLLAVIALRIAAKRQQQENQDK